METWRDMTIVHRGQAVTVDGVGFAAIGRLELLRLLQQRVRDAGVELSFGAAVPSMEAIAGYDLIVGADGINSMVRRACEGDFAFSLSQLDSKFVWYGTTKTFETLTQTFVDSEFGPFNAHHYRYAPGMSTFIVECDRATWVAAGLHEASDAESRSL